MSAIISALLLGALFAVGLLISGMTDPANIKGFLDITGHWRPQLIAVLGAGVIVTWIVYAFARKQTRPLVESTFRWPAATHIDAPLVTGAALFGTGWALAGYCPGPALVAIGSLTPAAIVFVLAMIAGSLAHRAFAQNAASKN
jgi:uncharacterized protein